MSTTKYTYSVSNDFPDGKVNASKLAQEISGSAIVTALATIEGAGDVLDIYFKDQLSSGDKTLLDGDTTNPAGGLIASHDNSENQNIEVIKFAKSDGTTVDAKFDSEGYMRVSSEMRDGTKFNAFSHNWCDKCTWYQESTKATDETLTDSGDGLTFNSAHDFWIDMTHGRVTDEDRVVYLAGNKWIPIVKVNDVVQESGFTINYPNGDVTFSSSKSGQTVKATYWYAGSGKFTVSVPSNKQIQLLRVEVQFSKNTVFNDTMVFTPKGYASVFAPQLVPPLNPTDLVALDFPNKYKCAKDYINESNGSHPLIPAFNELQNEVIILVWDYLSRTDLYGQYGMCIEIEMQNNIPHTGEIGSATFYGILRDICP